MYGGANFLNNQVNNATQAIGQAGSTFKPFALAAARRGGHRARLDVERQQRHRPIDGYKVNNYGDESLGPDHAAQGHRAVGELRLRRPLAGRSATTRSSTPPIARRHPRRHPGARAGALGRARRRLAARHRHRRRRTPPSPRAASRSTTTVLKEVRGANGGILFAARPDAEAGLRPGHRRHRELRAAARSSPTAPARGARARPPGGRQDGHDEREQVRVLRRLHPRPRRRGDARQGRQERQLPVSLSGVGGLRPVTGGSFPARDLDGVHEGRARRHAGRAVRRADEPADGERRRRPRRPAAQSPTPTRRPPTPTPTPTDTPTPRRRRRRAPRRRRRPPRRPSGATPVDGHGRTGARSPTGRRRDGAPCPDLGARGATTHVARSAGHRRRSGCRGTSYGTMTPVRRARDRLLEPSPARRPTPLVAAATERIGGPLGRTARGFVGFWTPLRVLVLLATIVVRPRLPAASCPATLESFGGDARYTRLCYSDIPLLYAAARLRRRLAARTSRPAAAGPGAGVPGAHRLLHAGRRRGSPARAAASSERAMLVLRLERRCCCSCCLLVTVVATALTVRRRPWDAAMVALAPGVILCSLINWDLLAVALTAGVDAAWSRSRPGWAGVLLGLAVAAKFYPVLLLGPLFLLCLRAGPDARVRRHDGARPLGGVARGQRAGLPGEPRRLGGVLHVLHRRAAPTGARPGTCCRSLGHAGAARARSTGSPSAPLGVLCLGIACARRVGAARPRYAQLAFLVVAAFCLTNKVYSPQYVLWLIPLAAMARPRWRDFLIWQTGEVLYFAAIWYFLQQYGTDNKGLPEPAGTSRDRSCTSLAHAVLRRHGRARHPAPRARPGAQRRPSRARRPGRRRPRRRPRPTCTSRHRRRPTRPGSHRRAAHAATPTTRSPAVSERRGAPRGRVGSGRGRTVSARAGAAASRTPRSAPCRNAPRASAACAPCRGCARR